MSWLDSLFRKSDPTRKWVADPGLALDFDFSRHALCGVKIGDPLEWLSKLGPAEEKRRTRSGRFRYFSRGLDVTAGEGVINSYLLIWDVAGYPGYQPFAGACRYQGRSLALRAGAGEAVLAEAFGPPYWRDQDDEEILLFYEFGEVERTVEFNLQGGLVAIDVATPPLLANEQQRKAYGVTKPWPPPNQP